MARYHGYPIDIQHDSDYIIKIWDTVLHIVCRYRDIQEFCLGLDSELDSALEQGSNTGD